MSADRRPRGTLRSDAERVVKENGIPFFCEEAVAAPERKIAPFLIQRRRARAARKPDRAQA